MASNISFVDNQIELLKTMNSRELLEAENSEQ
jgi:hypothetical protein